MKCHHCDKQATVHLTQILNGQMHKMDLCESCAQAKGVTNPENLSIGSLMENASEGSEDSSSPMTCERVVEPLIVISKRRKAWL